MGKEWKKIYFTTEYMFRKQKEISNSASHATKVAIHPCSRVAIHPLMRLKLTEPNYQPNLTQTPLILKWVQVKWSEFKLPQVKVASLWGAKSEFKNPSVLSLKSKFLNSKCTLVHNLNIPKSSTKCQAY